MNYIVSFKVDGNAPSEQRMGQILTKLGYDDFEAINTATWRLYSSKDIKSFTSGLLKDIGSGIPYLGGKITGVVTEEER